MSHIIRYNTTPPHLFLCGSSFPNCTLIGLAALRVGKPQLLCELRAHEGMCCLYINSLDISTIYLTYKVQKN